MKSIIMQSATHCSVLQFNYIPTNWKGSIWLSYYVIINLLLYINFIILYGEANK